MSINKAVYVEDTFCYKDYVCQVSKLQHYMYVIGLKWIFFLKFKWKVLKQINPNLAGLSRGSLLPPWSNETSSLKTILSFDFGYISYILYIRPLWPICFNKKFEQEKKGLYKSISKSIHVDTILFLSSLLSNVHVLKKLPYCFMCT